MHWSKLKKFLPAVAVVAFVVAGCDDDDPVEPGENPPSAPTNVAAAAVDNDVVVTWTPGEGATAQRVELDGPDINTRTQDIANGTTGQATFEDLPRGQTYDVGVTAINSDGEASAATSVDVPLNANFTDAAGSGYDNQGFWTDPVVNNLIADPLLTPSALIIGSQSGPPDFIPTSTPAGYSPVAVAGLGGIVMPTDGRMLVNTAYAGAVAPGTALTDAWYYGWTVWATDGSDSRDGPNDGSPLPVVTISGDILADATWTSDNLYVLDGPVFVGADCGQDPGSPLGGCNAVTLTIEPGTTIVGLRESTDPQARGSYLVVTRGSQIIADALDGAVARRPTEAEMIVFTSDAPKGSRARGDWGGLVLNGRGQINTGDEASGEGDSGLFGGVDDTDSSGILRGVRVEFAGDDVTATDQLNGIAFQGTGAGTTVDYVQVHYNIDDGTEPFGGAVSQTHMVVTGIGDDSYDGTDGYRGFIQFAIAQQRGDNADNGLELSNNGDNETSTPKSTAIIANATLVGAGVNGEISTVGGGGDSDIGILQREGSNWRIYNTIVTNFGDAGFNVEGAVAAANADARLGGSTTPDQINSVEGSIIWGNVVSGSGD